MLLFFFALTLIIHQTELKNIHHLQRRLAGGLVPCAGEFPYLAISLHEQLHCTTAIITEQWLLGAAHCYIIRGKRIDPKEMFIVAGILDYQDKSCKWRQVRQALEIHLHPKFKEKQISKNDIGLVKVEPFEFNLAVQSIPLSGKPFPIDEEVRCTAAGWGDTDRMSFNSVLRKLDVIAAQSPKACPGLQINQRRRVICLVQDEGKGLCDGDSGGPLVCDGEMVGVAHQVYLETYKNFFAPPPDSMDCGAREIVHTYMFTCPFLDWIKSYVPEVPPQPPHCFYRRNSYHSTPDYRRINSFLLPFLNQSSVNH
nr:PREDICTED: chymotrypsin-2-like isoform X1 [Bemisia tabaci]XP_018913366.1 PREDICTED: chymotrypsin-2-like isoform X1 [Bemisia tabaci]